VFFSPLAFRKSVRLTPESLCGMFRNHCAPYPGITVRHRPDFALYNWIYD
jgi:hypothetical protein